MKLTYPQQCAIRKLTERDWQTAFAMCLPAATLIALEKRGMVKRRRIAHSYYDSTDYEWSLILSNVRGEVSPLASGGADAPASDVPEVPQARGLTPPRC